MNYVDWLVDWFGAHGADASDVKEHLDANFFDMGYIDSFAFITLMSDVEEEFGITFDNERFHDRAFSTVRGFAAALAEEHEE